MQLFCYIEMEVQPYPSSFLNLKISKHFLEYIQFDMVKV